MDDDRYAFLSEKPPLGYIAGIGRGATGFSSRGTARKNNIPKRYHEASLASQPNDADAESETQDEDIFKDVEARLAKSSKRTKTVGLIEAGLNRDDKFADAKQRLSQLTEEDWLQIPEASDYTRRNKRNRLEAQMNRNSYAAPDSLLHKKSIDLTKFNEERSKLFAQKMDENILDDLRPNPIFSATLHSTEDTEIYIRELENAELQNSTQTENLTKKREVFASYIKSDPRNPDAWIGAASLEYDAKNYDIARKIIQKGCEKCPHSSDIWLECIRLHSYDKTMCKALVASALSHNKGSHELWQCAVDLESDVFRKKQVLQYAIRENPHNEIFWLNAVSLEEDAALRVKILQKGYKMIPNSFKILQLVVERLEYNEARSAIAKANETSCEQDFRIRVLESCLEEKHDLSIDWKRLTRIINRENWPLGILESIDLCRTEIAANYKKTINAVLYVSIDHETESIDASRILSVIAPLQSELKLIVYQQILPKHPTSLSIWTSFRTFCDRLGCIDELFAVFQGILFSAREETRTYSEKLQRYPVLALMYAKEKWAYGDVTEALSVLKTTTDTITTYADAWKARLKILAEEGLFEEWKKVYSTAIEKVGAGLKEELHCQYVDLLLYESQIDKAKIFMIRTLEKESSVPEYYLKLSQIHLAAGNCKEAQSVLKQGLRNCGENVASLWLGLSKIDRSTSSAKARSDLETALLHNPENIELYKALFELEFEVNGNKTNAQCELIISKAMRRFPRDPYVWQMKLKAQPSKVVFQDALKFTDQHCVVCLEIGKWFYEQHQNYQVASKWFRRALTPEFGDSWVWNGRVLIKLDDKSGLKDLRERILREADPKFGDEWFAMVQVVENRYLSNLEILDKLIH